ncbi:Aldehyde dehydrogenase [Trichophyton tonsurans CBS 112818]|uniref:Aldehyde dehydrogenase n=1 Tax=Trichophyton tonsurans (strain CBS 112818) TaxID=647933 RepID=F2RW86_TRIT1|nr:Aldehyde dehydrogenase [Trichophyton tonsurans CBS 112818]
MALTQKIETPTATFEQPLGLFINNKYVKGAEGKTFETINPHNEKVICAVHEATEKDVDAAVAAARAAVEGPWRKVTPSERGRMLTKLADLLERDIETIAAIEALDNGKALSMAKADVTNAAGCLRYYGGWADKVEGKVIDTDHETFTYTRHEPVGVCGQIIPWNFPLLMFAWKIGPALATGNSIVMKTQSSPSQRSIRRHQTSSPNIVFNDADIDNAISWVNFGIYYNHGQCCCAGSRILVQEGIYDKFMARFKERANQNKVGDPFKPDTFQGPQISQLQFDRIMGYIEEGKKAGAKVEVGGERHGNEGYYIQPTIFSECTDDMKIVKEEIFGPVCTVQKFSSEEDAIRIANNSSYGLAAALHTKDLNTSIRVSNALKAGTVWVNCYNLISYQSPFGGFKESGIGRELGEYALDNYTQIKTVRIRLGDAMFG